jgi:hypothetical protein
MSDRSLPSKQKRHVFTYQTRVYVTSEQDKMLREFAVRFGRVEHSLWGSAKRAKLRTGSRPSIWSASLSRRASSSSGSSFSDDYSSCKSLVDNIRITGLAGKCLGRPGDRVVRFHEIAVRVQFSPRYRG